jgi:geranylgeranyl diphosphate synthase type II
MSATPKLCYIHTLEFESKAHVPMQAFLSRLKTGQAHIEAALQTALRPHLPELLWEAMAYSALDGGKRIRPVLMQLTTEALGADPALATPAACALELIHCYSLVHDDLPALDNDDWRRGRPSNHRQFGEATAILAGDALLTYAFELCTAPGPLSAEVRIVVAHEIARAAGPHGMCGGQMLDMQLDPRAPLGPDTLAHMYALKTGQLLRVAVRCGAIIGGATPAQLHALTTYAEQLGVAFQIIDDILDLTGTLDSLGKTPQKDVHQQKYTYPQVYGLEPAQEMGRACVKAALSALNEATLPAPEWLEAIAHYLTERQA